MGYSESTCDECSDAMNRQTQGKTSLIASGETWKCIYISSDPERRTRRDSHRYKNTSLNESHLCFVSSLFLVYQLYRFAARALGERALSCSKWDWALGAHRSTLYLLQLHLLLRFASIFRCCCCFFAVKVCLRIMMINIFLSLSLLQIKRRCRTPPMPSNREEMMRQMTFDITLSSTT